MVFKRGHFKHAPADHNTVKRQVAAILQQHDLNVSCLTKQQFVRALSNHVREMEQLTGIPQFSMCGSARNRVDVFGGYPTEDPQEVLRAVAEIDPASRCYVVYQGNVATHDLRGFFVVAVVDPALRSYLMQNTGSKKLVHTEDPKRIMYHIEKLCASIRGNALMMEAWEEASSSPVPLGLGSMLVLYGMSDVAEMHRGRAIDWVVELAQHNISFREPNLGKRWRHAIRHFNLPTPALVNYYSQFGFGMVNCPYTRYSPYSRNELKSPVYSMYDTKTKTRDYLVAFRAWNQLHAGDFKQQFKLNRVPPQYEVIPISKLDHRVIDAKALDPRMQDRFVRQNENFTPLPDDVSWQFRPSVTTNDIQLLFDQMFNHKPIS